MNPSGHALDADALDLVATRVVQALRRADATVATAESLTGGLVCAALVGVVGASEVVKGSVVAYDAALKVSLLGVSPEVLEGQGPVSVAVAQEMAHGAMAACGADWAVATTGVAGPADHGGRAPGTFVVAVAHASGVKAVHREVRGTRGEVRLAASVAALELLESSLADGVGRERTRNQS